jgi:lysozyme
MQILPMVVDLSHWDPASDYNQVKSSGIYGVIYKATEGTSFTDDTYVSQQYSAKSVGLLWGAFHFADGGDVHKQIDNFLQFASPDPDELFGLDWEDNGGNKMSAADAKTWITEVENQLNRPNQCVVYSGNTAKEKIQGKDAFFGARRLWLCQYTSGTPTWQASWDNYWLWQFTDGVNGPTPHSINGVGNCDISSFDREGGADVLKATWATGEAQPTSTLTPPLSLPSTTSVVISAPPGITVKVRQVTAAIVRDVRPRRALWEAKTIAIPESTRMHVAPTVMVPGLPVQPAGDPPWLIKARSFIGTTWNNGPMPPTIKVWMQETAAQFPEMAAECQMLEGMTYWKWCGGFVQSMLAYSNIRGPFGSTDLERWPWAFAWETWGADASDNPQPGDVLVFKWADGGGHVTFYDHEVDDNNYHYTGGDQGTSCTVSTESASTSYCVAVRRPPAA